MTIWTWWKILSSRCAMHLTNSHLDTLPMIPISLPCGNSQDSLISRKKERIGQSLLIMDCLNSKATDLSLRKRATLHRRLRKSRNEKKITCNAHTRPHPHPSLNVQIHTQRLENRKKNTVKTLYNMQSARRFDIDIGIGLTLTNYYVTFES